MDRKKIKVCILTSVHEAFNIRIFFKEALTLARAGYDVSLIAPHEKDETKDGINIIHLDKKENRLFRFISTFTELLPKALKQKADIYHFHDPELIPVCLLLKLLTIAKIIYDIHENIPKQILSKPWIAPFLRKPISIVFMLFQPAIMNCFDRNIFAWSEPNQQLMTNNKTAVIANYPRYELYDVQKHLSRTKNGFTLIYCGGLTEVRGIREIVKSLGYIDLNLDLRLKLIGGFGNKSFENEIKSFPEWNKINYLGTIQYTETIDHYLEADTGLICVWPVPHNLISTPNKLFEYMAAGLPVIASNFPLWKEIVEGNRCGICVNPLDPKEIASAIKYLIKHPEEALEMGKNGRKAVEEKYNWENESKKLIELYKDLLASS